MRDSRRFSPLYLLFGALILASLTLGLWQGGYLDGVDILAGGDDARAGPPPPAASSTEDGATDDSATADSPTENTADSPTEDGATARSGGAFDDAEDAASDDTNPDKLVIRIEPSNLEPDDGIAPATATIRNDGKLYVEGAFRTEDEAERFLTDAADVFGEEAIVAQYVIDSAAPNPDVSDIALEKPVLFKSGSAEIDPEYIPFLEACGNVLKVNPQIVMSITAITDATGDSQLNLELSQQRADAIVAFYRSMDIGNEQLVATGLGESAPVADNTTEEGREQNRRAMLELLNVISDGE